MADIKWRYNKDNPKLKNTTDVFVYSLSTHQPIYYRLFPVNVTDISTVRSILSDMRALGINDLIFLSDRGYVSEINIATFVSMDTKFLMAARTDRFPVSNIITKIEYSKNGFPINMTFNKEKNLFVSQFNIDEYTSMLSDSSRIKIKGLKANIYLDLKKRVDEMCFIYEKINKEKNILKSDIEKKHIPNDIKNTILDLVILK